jgi:hypothetical protein
MSGSRSRRALLGLLAFAAALSLLGPARGLATQGGAQREEPGAFATTLTGADGPSHAVTPRATSWIPHAVGQLAVAGAAASLLTIAALWHLIASSEGSDAALGALGVRWRRRGPPRALLPA